MPRAKYFPDAPRLGDASFGCVWFSRFKDFVNGAYTLDAELISEGRQYLSGAFWCLKRGEVSFNEWTDQPTPDSALVISRVASFRRSREVQRVTVLEWCKAAQASRS
jgi:hypothetical protein